MLLSEVNGAPTVWVIVNHLIWWPSAVVQIDPITGRGTVKFVNSGQLYALALVQSDGIFYVLAGGINKEYRTGALTIFDPQLKLGASPQGENSVFQCRNCGGGRPVKYLLFPRSELSRVMGVPTHTVCGFVFFSKSIVELSTCELPNGQMSGTQRYEMPVTSLSPESVSFDDGYRTAHLQLQTKGKLGHDFEDCPERTAPRLVRTWGAGSGWSELRVPALPRN